MKTDPPARQLFRRLIRQPDTQLSLAEAALAIAWEDQGGSAPMDALRDLDAMAATLRQRITGLSDPQQIIAVINHHLFDELGFQGNPHNYNDPVNSYLDRVLAMRTGLPITLSVIYMEVGWRLGLPIAGLALPGHFIVRYTAPDHEIFIDPFHQGREWSQSECEAQVRSAYPNADAALMERVMTVPSKLAILTRMLRNLKNAHFMRQDFPRALAAVERLVLLDPDNVMEVRDRSLLRVKLGQWHGALEDLDRYAQTIDGTLDMLEIQRLAQYLVVHLAAGN